MAMGGGEAMGDRDEWGLGERSSRFMAKVGDGEALVAISGGGGMAVERGGAG